MKILYFSSHPNLYLNVPAGPGVHMREVIRGFEALGHEVKPVIMGGLEEPITPPSNGDTTSHTGGGIKNLVKRFIPNYLWQTMKDVNLRRFDGFAAQELESEILKWKPDLIYERCYYGMTSGVDVAKRHGIPLFLEMNAPYPEERVDMEGKSAFGTWARKQEKKQVAGSERIVVVSSALKEYIGKIDADALEKTVITPNAIRNGFTSPTAEKIDNLRKQYQIGEGPVIGFVGSIFPYHGVDRLILSFANLVASFPNAHLMIVGDGAILPDLKALAKDKGVENQCTFTGKVPHADIFKHIGIMDITVMATSNWYGSPVKIFEYGAMEKAIIAPNVIPVTDVMKDGVDGLLVEPETVSIQKAMETLLKDDALRSKVSSTFYEKVMQEHTWNRMAELILADFSV